MGPEIELDTSKVFTPSGLLRSLVVERILVGATLDAHTQTSKLSIYLV